MKRIFILTVLFFLCVGSVWAQGVNDNLNKGVSRSGGVYNGCDCEDGQDFVTRQGNDTLIPHVMRTGNRLEVTVSDACKVLGCGTTDKEAIVEVKIQWTGNTISRITACGLKYHSTNLDCNQDKNWKIDSYPVSICGDSTLQLRLNLSCPDNTYEVQAFVVLLSTKDTVFSNIDFVTKKRNKCGGWVPYDASIEHSVHQDDVDSIDLVYDHQGNEYGVVQIGKQCWIRENVRCSTSPNGYLAQAPVTSNADPSDIIYQVSDETPYFYRFDALNISFQQRGALYNWPAAVDTFGAVKELPPGVRRGICPEGWHVPNIYEWFELVKEVLYGLNDVNQPFDFLSKNDQGQETGSKYLGDSVVRLALGCQWPAYKQNGTPYPNNFPGGYMSNPDRRNTSGFSAVPANNLQETGKLGYYDPQTSPNLKYIANFWLATPHLTDIDKAFMWIIDEDKENVTLSSHNRYRKRGFSVRCLRDQLTIAVTPNKSTICVPYEVTYTAKVAQEDLQNFKFYWKVYKGGALVVNTIDSTYASTNTFSYIHYGQDKYKIECNATRGQVGSDNYKNLSDSVFINANCDSHFLVASPEGETRCIGETVNITADSLLAKIIKSKDHLNFDNDAAYIHWYLSTNGEAYVPYLNGETKVQYTFNSTGKFKFKFEDTRTPSDVIEDSITIIVSDVPYLTVCPDCDSRGFVIRESGTTVSACWFTTLSNGQDSTIAYAHANGALVPINDPNLTYSVAMVSSAGCRDTLQGLRLTTRVRCTANGGLLDNEVRYGTDDTKIDSVRDHQDNTYAVVEIGGRCWMRENMRATTTPNYPDSIIVNPQNHPKGTKAIQSYTSRVAHWYNNDSTTNAKYGLLYNWCAAADTSNPAYPKVANASNTNGQWSCILPANWRGICPEGWHLPTNQEWASLEEAVNGTQKNPGRLCGGLDWVISSTPKTPGYYVRNNSNTQYEWGSSGFCAIPAGHYNVAGSQTYSTMADLGKRARFWTATEGANINQAYQRDLKSFNSIDIDRGAYGKNRGMSVRCIRNLP